MLLSVNISLIQYAIKENLHVEYFLWSYFKKLNPSGFHKLEELPLDQFCLSTLDAKSKDNIFYSCKNSCFILKSRNSFQELCGKRYFSCEYSDLLKYARFFSKKKGKIWNSTTIKYFLISVYACRYANKKPYAIPLICQDLGVSPSTVQRAMNLFDVKKHHKPQIQYSPRSYYAGRQHINLSPNFNCMPFGKNIKLRF